MTSLTRRLACGVCAAAALGIAPPPRAAQHATPRQALEDTMLCQAPQAVGTESRYTVTGRVKLLLIWTGRRNVGDAQFVSRAGGGTSRLALLVGTDPDTAPMRLNRWGYIAETSCDAGTIVTGVMTESNEQSIDQAQAGTKGTQNHPPLRAIRSRVLATESATETVTIIPARLHLPGS